MGLPPESDMESDQIRGLAMNLLGNGLSAAKHHGEALSVKEAELAMMRRDGWRVAERMSLRRRRGARRNVLAPAGPARRGE